MPGPIDMSAVVREQRIMMGELAAIKAFCSALIASHPDPQGLKKAFHLAEVMTAQLLNEPGVPDEALDGMQNVARILNSHLDAAISRQS